MELYSNRVEQLNFLMAKLKNTKLSQFIKKKILKLRVAECMEKQFPYLTANMAEYKREFDKMLEHKERNDRVGIPTAGATRKWNNIFYLMEFVIKYMLEIRQLYVFCLFVLFFLFIYFCLFLFFAYE